MAHGPETPAEGGLPARAAAAGLATTDDWRALFARYSEIVLVANSTASNVAELRAHYPADALFVFFNKVFKVLDQPFEGHAILITRGQPRGAGIVYRGEVDEVLSFFDRAHFLGIMNIRLADDEKPNTSADFHNAATGHLDLRGHFDPLYTEGKVPTSGFAMALWLSELRLPGRITLAGFSARRSDKWRVVSVHDWSYEQVFLRLFARLGKIAIHGGAGSNPYQKLSERFPEIPPAEIALAAAEVLSERLSNTDAEVDKLISLTNIIRSADNFLRRLKPSLLKRRRQS